MNDYSSDSEDDELTELYKDRSESFRKAVRAPKKTQRYLAGETELNDLEDIGKNGAVNPGIEYSHKAPERSKYNWKQFLPWAPKTKG